MPNRLLKTREEIEELVAELRRHDMVAFDTEFIRETTFFPQLALIQVGTAERTWLVDAVGRDNGELRKRLQPLIDFFQDEKFLKIAHAALGDQECLYTSLGIVAKPLFDTAQAASLCGFGESVGLSTLLNDVLGVKLKKGHARTNWLQRPLPPQLLEYAHADVADLVRLTNALLERLDRLGRREWAMDLSAELTLTQQFEVSPEEIAAKLYFGGKVDAAGYPILVALVEWRENRIRELNVPRRWVADDQLLIDLARVRPKDVDHLKSFRGINKGEIQKNGDRLISIIRNGGAKGVNPPARDRMRPPSPDESRVMDLIKLYVGILSDQHEIAAKHLLNSKNMLAMIRAKPASVEDLVAGGFLSHGAAKLIGEEILAVLAGERMFRLARTQHGSLKIDLKK